VRAAALVVLLALVPASVCAKNPRAHSTPKAPTVAPPARTADQFVAQAAGRSLAGIELSDLALGRSENAAV